MEDKINCLIVDDEPVAREILENHLKRIPAMLLVGSCESAVQAFQMINSNKIDLIFLDINMPEISGLSFAKSINKKIKIIFTTAYREYAVEGFDLQAVDYLLKPISFERLEKAIHKYLGMDTVKVNQPLLNVSQEKSDFIFVKSDRKMIKIAFNEILFVESLGDYLKIFTSKKSVVCRETIANMEAKLPGDRFMRIHRSFIVAVTKIDSYTHEYVEIHNKALPISRSYKKEVLQRLEAY